MFPAGDGWLRLGAVLLSGLLGHAQATVQSGGPTAASPRWQNDALTVTVDGATWSQAIPFKALAANAAHRRRFMQSRVTAQQNMRPDGPNRMGQAEFNGEAWLRWGEGTAPLLLDVAQGWPYRLVADRNPTDGPLAYRWSTADTSHQITAPVDEIQTVQAPDGVWCAWFTVTGSAQTRAGIADGRIPRIHWMLWRPGGRKACF